MVETLRRRIDRAVTDLRRVGYPAQPVSEPEFLDYIHGETARRHSKTS